MDNNKIGVILVVLAVLIIGYGSYRAYDEFYVKRDIINNETPNDNKDYSLNDDLVSSLLTVVRVDPMLLQTLENGQTTDFNDWQKVLLSIGYADKTNRIKLLDSTLSTSTDGYISVDDLLLASKELFGSTITYQNKNFEEFQSYTFKNDFYDEIVTHNAVQYNENDSQYTISLYKDVQSTKDGVSYYDIAFDSKENNGEYIIKCYRFYYIKTFMEPNLNSKLYSDYLLNNVIYDMSNTEYQNQLEGGMVSYIIDPVKFKEEAIKLGKENKLSLVTYTFKKENNNVVWVEYNLKGM